MAVFYMNPCRPSSSGRGRARSPHKLHNVHYAQLRVVRIGLHCFSFNGLSVVGLLVTALLWASQLQSCGTFHAWLSALQ